VATTTELQVKELELAARTRLRPPSGDGAESAARAVTEVASQGGLAEVTYGFADSPTGRLLLALTRRGLVTLAFPGQGMDEPLDRLSREVSPRIVESQAATDGVRRELDSYFEGRLRSFSTPVDLRLIHATFGRKVLEQTSRIPFGSVSTYREVAARAGSPRGMRAAGNALGANPIPIVVPCHRVVRTGGGLGGYTSGLDIKRLLLRLEGVLPAEEED
jgi:methylated-DNA-[protein]-cysteine S-methyltransferase